MSALDDILKYGNATPDINEWIAWSQQARAELAQTRAAAAEAQVAHVYLDESPVNGDADDTPIELADRIAVLVGDVIALRATVAEQARAIVEAREVIASYRALHLGPAGYCSYPMTAHHEMADIWLAAHPAPQADEAQ